MSLDSETISALGDNWEQGFDRHRSLQNNPLADIVRCQVTGGDIGTGAEPTVTDISIPGCECLRLPRSHPAFDVQEYADEAGRLMAGMVCLGFRHEVLRTDRLRFPAGGNDLYEIIAVAKDEAAGEWWVLGRIME